MNLRQRLFILSLINVCLHYLPLLGISSLGGILWGLSANLYLPRYVFVIQIVLFLIVLGMLLMNSNFLEFRTINISLFRFFWAAGFITICIVLQEATLLFGDSLLLAKKIEVVLPRFPVEPLSIFVYRMLYLILPKSIKTGANVYHIVNTLCVIPAIFCYIKISKQYSVKVQPAVLLILSFFGINSLFMGHVENYTLVFVSMLIYFVLITRSEPRTEFIFFFFSLSLCFHFIAILLLPSFLYVLVKNFKSIKWRKSLLFFVTPFLLTILMGFCAGLSLRSFFGGIFDILFDFVGKEAFSSYFKSIFNSRHFLDIINLLFFNTPSILIFCGFCIWEGIGKDSANKAHGKLFLFVMIPFLLFVVFFNSPLGFARDWDLGCICIFWFSLFTVDRFVRTLCFHNRCSSLLLMISFISILLVLPWFLNNHSEQSSLKRFEDILKAHSRLSGTAYGYEALGRYYWDKKDFAMAAKYYSKAIESSPENWRFWTCAGLSYLYNNEPLKALANLRNARSLFQNDARIFAGLGTAYSILGMKDSALTSWERAFALDSSDLNILLNLAIANFYKCNYQRAVFLLKKTIGQQKFYDAYILLFDVYYADKKLIEAKKIVDEMEQIFGETPDVIKRRQLINLNKEK